MDHQHPLVHFEKLLFELTLQTRKLSQKKNELNRQIEVCRAEIKESTSYIETTRGNITKLEEEIDAKQKTVEKIKANAKSMRVTSTLLQQYEKTLKAELDRRQENYNQDTKAYEERIASARKVFQQHEEYYCKHPLAKKHLAIQTEKQEIEHRIKTCEDQIIMKQKELDSLTGQTLNASSTDNTSKSISDELTITESEKQLDQHTEEDINSSIALTSLDLTQLKDGHGMSRDLNTEEKLETNIAEETHPYSPAPEEASHKLWSNPASEQRQQSDEMPSADQDRGNGSEGQEEHSTISGREEPVEEMQEMAAEKMEQTSVVTEEEDKEGTTPYLQPASPTSVRFQSPPAGEKVAYSTPTLSLNCSPDSCTGQGTSDGKSPAFHFSLNPDPSTPGFSGFVFDMVSTLEEDSPFMFTNSYFSEKKTTESKAASGFLFEQTEKSEDEFPFSFGATTPEMAIGDQDEASEEAFPFSINFGKC